MTAGKKETVNMKHPDVFAKRMLAAFLAALSLLLPLGCAEKAEPQTAVQDTTSAAAETEPAETELKPDLPQKDLDGYEFTVYSRDADHHTKEVFSEELNGEVVNDAVFQRNLTVESAYNVKLSALLVTESPESTMQTNFNTIVMAGDDAFDVALMHTVYAGSTALNGTAYNWWDVPYVDFDKPWWNSVLPEELDLDGLLFLAVSDYCISAIDYTWCIVYNLAMAKRYNIDDIYPVIEDGNWDFETFRTLAASAASDLNGDGQMDWEDQYGFISHFNSAVCNWSFAFDIRYVGRDDSGKPYVLPQSEKMADATEMLYDLFFDSGSSLHCTDAICTKMGSSNHDVAISDYFAGGKALFAALRVYVIDRLRGMEEDFGIIPFPKFSADQDAYYTHVDGHAPLMILPKTLTDPENAGIVMEALAYESHRSVVPAVYEIVLQEKFARDEASKRMLDLILDGRVYTFGYIYDDWNGMQWTLRKLMDAKSKDYASYYASQLSSAQNQLQKVLDAFEAVEGGN